MAKFNPLNFVADHAGMNLVDAIKEAYEQGKRDAHPEQPSEIQDILDYLDTVLHPIISPEHWNVYSELHDMISCLPSAQSEHKMGRWIVRYECPNCGEGRSYAFDTCPMCGADMRGKQDEQFEGGIY